VIDSPHTPQATLLKRLFFLTALFFYFQFSFISKQIKPIFIFSV